ncbi:TPA: hypothetical protein O0254_002773, partial [Staphylococcus aureus]|nr:hypothetical protein [Staphylococcus aureus]HDJ1308343.1 hypothetical protein [Staphylococcus aureus]
QRQIDLVLKYNTLK